MRLTGLAVHALKSGAAEDDWASLTVGEVGFRVAKPTSRCVMALARHRLFGGETMFAAHLVPRSGGKISVGDEVSVA